MTKQSADLFLDNTWQLILIHQIHFNYFIYLKSKTIELYTKRRSFNRWFSPQMSTTAGHGSSQNQEPGSPLTFPRCVSETNIQNTSAAFLYILAESQIKVEQPGTDFMHILDGGIPKSLSNPLCQNVGHTILDLTVLLPRIKEG